VTHTQWIYANVIIGSVGILAALVAAVAVLRELRRAAAVELPARDD
jgi:hypothetical protein